MGNLGMKAANHAIQNTPAQVKGFKFCNTVGSSSDTVG
jgi:hypothetical protein